VERRGLKGALALLVLVLACRDDGGALDRADLKNAMAADVALDRALKTADDAEMANHDDEAADILKRTAAPAADDALAAANAVSPRTAWGKKEKDALVALVRDRKDEVGRYERALRGTDMDEKVAAVEKQLAIEKRASALSQEIDRGP
jgi:hypothetical protein